MGGRCFGALKVFLYGQLCSASGIWNSAAQLPLNGAKQSSKPVNAFRVEFGGLGHTSSVGLIANLALERHI